jgi:hypothetical protein
MLTVVHWRLMSELIPETHNVSTLKRQNAQPSATVLTHDRGAEGSFRKMTAEMYFCSASQPSMPRKDAPALAVCQLEGGTRSQHSKI